eukprot:scaffold73009_cov71-Phaeocystis_antarctica.AAC.1
MGPILRGASCKLQAVGSILRDASCQLCKLQSHQKVSAPRRIGPIDQSAGSQVLLCSLQLAKHSHERQGSFLVISLGRGRGVRGHTPRGLDPVYLSGSLRVPDVCLPLTPPRPQHPHTSLSPRATATTSVSVTVYGRSHFFSRLYPGLPVGFHR